MNKRSLILRKQLLATRVQYSNIGIGGEFDNKREKISIKIYAVMESLRQYDICIGTNWIMGFPEDTNETLQDTFDLIEDIKPDRANVGILTPYPGTPIFDQCIKDKLFVKEIDLENYWKAPFQPHQTECVIKPYDMSLEEMEVWRLKFDSLRYKYFGNRNPVFKLPLGFVRDEQGLVKSA